MIETSNQQMFETAEQHHRAGRLAESEAVYRRLIEAEPLNSEALTRLGTLLSQSNRHAEALEIFERAIEGNPLSADLRARHGVVLESLGRIEDAVTAFQIALDIDPEIAGVWMRLASALNRLSRWDESIDACRAGLKLAPEDAQLHDLFSAALRGKGKPREALLVQRRAAALQPTNPALQVGLGNALMAQGELNDAVAAFSTAIEMTPDYAEAYNNLGNALYLQGDLDAAIGAYQRATNLRPDLADTYVNLANVLERRGRLEEALKVHLQVVHMKPDYAPAHRSVGDGYHRLGMHAESVAAYRKATELDPNDVSSFNSLGHVLLGMWDLDGAIAAYQRVLQLDPKSYKACSNLGFALNLEGRLDEALARFDQAQAMDPTNAAIGSNRVYLLTFHPGYDAAAQSAELRKWNQTFAAQFKDRILPFENDRNSHRRLKIGYVSPDLRFHVVGQNMLPLLTAHDHQNFEIHCYSSAARNDPATDMIRPLADVWHDVAQKSDEELAALIRQDQIDILVDLTLHMSHNRLLVFARKPAPVQVTYLGYCGSTGLETMDYRFSDFHLDPADAQLSLYSEQTVHLPETYWCYTPAGKTTEPTPPPSVANGYITFGCLNNFSKVSAPALDLWAQVLAAIPKSRLILHAPQGAFRQDVLKRFTNRVVEADRVEFVPRQLWPAYIETLARIDIALDPIPYGGGITTCDALWMGVPVITLSGETAVGRGGRSILTNVGLPELICRRPKQFIQTAITLSQSQDRLIELRTTLRKKMQTSPLMNGKRFAKNVEAAYRTIWKNWCDAV
jgi:predicted O-linked N-acetylglucosamine transferase (SPINDLY family)